MSSERLDEARTRLVNMIDAPTGIGSTAAHEIMHAVDELIAAHMAGPDVEGWWRGYRDTVRAYGRAPETMGRAKREAIHKLALSLCHVGESCPWCARLREQSGELYTPDMAKRGLHLKECPIAAIAMLSKPVVDASAIASEMCAVCGHGEDQHLADAGNGNPRQCCAPGNSGGSCFCNMFRRDLLAPNRAAMGDYPAHVVVDEARGREAVRDFLRAAGGPDVEPVAGKNVGAKTAQAIREALGPVVDAEVSAPGHYSRHWREVLGARDHETLLAAIVRVVKERGEAQAEVRHLSGTSAARVREILQGQGSESAIEAAYRVIAERDRAHAAIAKLVTDSAVRCRHCNVALDPWDPRFELADRNTHTDAVCLGHVLRDRDAGGHAACASNLAQAVTERDAARRQRDEAQRELKDLRRRVHELLARLPGGAPSGA